MFGFVKTTIISIVIFVFVLTQFAIIIAKEYGLTLKSFFKDNFKYWDDSYLIPFIDIRLYKKQCYDFIISCCNNKFNCSKEQSCYGHQFLQFVETIIQFQRYEF